MTLAKVSAPTVGELTAMLFYNGSDSCLAAGHSLLRQLLPRIHAYVLSLPSGHAEQEQPTLPDGRVDRALVEKIILSMDTDTCTQQSFWLSKHRSPDLY